VVADDEAMAIFDEFLRRVSSDYHIENWTIF
jgi:hypothetical protein